MSCKYSDMIVEKLKSLKYLDRPTQKEICGIIGIKLESQSFVSNVYNGKKHFSLDHAVKIAKAFNFSLDEIFGLNDSGKNKTYSDVFKLLFAIDKILPLTLKNNVYWYNDEGLRMPIAVPNFDIGDISYSSAAIIEFDNDTITKTLDEWQHLKRFNGDGSDLIELWQRGIIDKYKDTEIGCSADIS